MTTEEIYTRVNTIYRTVLKKPELELQATTTAADVPGWDSLTHVMLIDAVEVDFKIKFRLSEVMNFKNVGDMCDCIARKLTA